MEARVRHGPGSIAIRIIKLMTALLVGHRNLLSYIIPIQNGMAGNAIAGSVVNNGNYKG